MNLPLPDADALAHSARLTETLMAEIDRAGGWLPFSRFMELALYAPGLGYYAAGARKFGAAGDFVTAPEMTGLFGTTVAAVAAEVMAQSAPQIIEVGAGSGQLAADLLTEMGRRGTVPDRYAILDLSADLRERQRATLARRVPQWLDRVVWLDALPESFAGFVVGNEVLDAMPVELHLVTETGLARRGVSVIDGRFAWADRTTTAVEPDSAAAAALIAQHALAPGHVVETSPGGRAWMAEWGRRLSCGLVLLFDYGFPAREFYHPQRTAGTLMCHYRHRAHGDPLLWPGLQDITAHVDFTAMARAAHGAGLSVHGYTGQAAFLMDAGLLDALAALPHGTPATIRETGAVQRLLSPAEMGELFKVLAVGRGLAPPLRGFRRGNRLASL